MKSCSRCARSYPDAEHFCSRDGTTLVETSPPAEMAGRVIGDRYRVLREIAEGGMGRIYLAEHVRTKRPVALKILDRQVAHDDRAIARFTAEAMIASGISHPNIAATYDSGETEDGLLYLALEYVEGQPLAEVVKREGQLAPARAAHIAREVAQALDAVHRAGVVHRDLKPGNIILAAGGNGADWPKLVDFGIALALESPNGDQPPSEQTLGTPDYMSPEQLEGKTVDGRSDVYSLALVTYHMLTGTLPFAPADSAASLLARVTDSPRLLEEVRPDIAWPPRLQHVMDRALSTDREERHPGAIQLADDLSSAIELMESAAVPRATLRRGTRARTAEITAVSEPVVLTRRPMLIAASVIVVVGIAIALWRGGAPASAAPAQRARQVSPAAAPVTPSPDRVDSGAAAGRIVVDTSPPSATRAVASAPSASWSDEMRARAATARRDLLLGRTWTSEGRYAEARARLLATRARLAPLIEAGSAPDFLRAVDRELARAAESNRSACAAEARLAKLRGEQGSACR
ncbi:MAG: serine/threonine protein kinase [Gemmatimonadota bacterium]|nr:serine/threonine protein kinase [Gemmatimonadota bacterium]